MKDTKRRPPPQNRNEAIVSISIPINWDAPPEIDLDEFSSAEKFPAIVDSYLSVYIKFRGDVDQRIRDWGQRCAPQADTLPWPASYAQLFDSVSQQVEDEELRARYMESDDPRMRLVYVRHMATAAYFAGAMSSLSDALMREDTKEAVSLALWAGKLASSLESDNLTRYAQRVKLNYKQARVGLDERANVEALNSTLKSKFPKDTPRFREVADRLDMLPDRVRYIINGPRRKKK